MLPQTRTTLLITAFLCLMTAAASSQTNIVVSPDPLWAPTFDSTYLSGLPGTDFTSTQSSAANQVDVDVAGLTAFNRRWILTASRADVSWDPALTLWIARTADGTSSGSLLGTPPALGTFLQITGASTELLRGRRVRTNIKYQLQVQGLSVLLDAATFTTTVTFTITEY